MTAYISLSYSKRKSADLVINAIAETLRELGIMPVIFVDLYKFDISKEKEMMQQAMVDINACDFLIAEVSEKAIGVGVEAGYAKGIGKPVIYVRRKDAEHSTTVAGISDYQVVFENVKDLQSQLLSVINCINGNRDL